MEDKKNWVDFKAIKAQVGIEQVLSRYGVNWLRREGEELRGRCPIHSGEGNRTFHASISKNAFQCFSCKARGNVLDFVSAMEHCSVRDAAVKLQQWFGIAIGENGSSSSSSAGGEKKKSSGAASEKKPVINPPLPFQLRIDSSTNYGSSRGVRPEVIEYFGAGLCISKGTFAGRFIIPLHDQLGQLVGYAGRSLDGKEPKYLFPPSEKGFHKSHLLFNLHRAMKEIAKDQPVIVVEGFFDCMKVKQAGFPAVAIMGSSLSVQQEEMLAAEFSRAVVMFDGDDAGKAATADCTTRLVRRMFVKAVDLPAGRQPDQLSEIEIREMVEG